MAGELFRFPRNYRLTKTDEFSSVFGFRKAVKGNFFMLHYGSLKLEMDHPRLGVVVAKKLVKQAVRRNGVKRIVREQFRLQGRKLPKVDLIVRLNNKIEGLPRQALATEIQQLFVTLQRRLNRETYVT